MKKPAILTSSWFLYSAGLILIVVPSMIMGIFGALSLSDLEKQPRVYNAEAKGQRQALHQIMLTAIYSKEHHGYIPGNSLREDDALKDLTKDLLPAPGFSVSGVRADVRTSDPPLKDESETQPESSPSNAQESQGIKLDPIPKGYLDLRTAVHLQGQLVAARDSLAMAALTFYGDELVGYRVRNGTPAYVDDPAWHRELAETYQSIRDHDAQLKTPSDKSSHRTSGFWSSAVQRAGGQEDRVAYLVGPSASAHLYADAASPDAKGYWVAWVIDTEALYSWVNVNASQLRTKSPLSFRALRQTDADLNEDSSIVTTLTFDPALLPMWTLAVSEDEQRMKFNSTSWRSNFYILIGAVGTPILVVVIFLLAARLRRELVDARKKVDFVANVTHELKTPLTSIRMFIEMLLMGRSRSPEDTRESLEIILRESERLGRLIDRVLEFNKLDRKAKLFDFQLESISNVVRETVGIFRNQLGPDSERKIKLVIQSGLPPALMDRDAFREVLLNLLTNAAKYSPAESPIGVRVFHEGRWIFTEVIDRGNGIPADEQDRIFDKFYRVKDELNRDVEGTGLGLTIAQQIVKAHNGTLTVDSRVGQGSRFIIKLPAASRLDETGRAPSVKRMS